MSRTRWTWVVVGGIATLLLVAGVDALRSSADSETSAPTASTTTTEIGSLLPCTQRDLRISIEVRDGVATVVARNIGAKECYRLLKGWRLAIEDRAGKLVAEWPGRGPLLPLADGFFPAGSEKDFGLPQDPPLCNSPGPFVALAAVGPYTARLGNLSRSEIGCQFIGDARRPVAKYVAQASAICSAADRRLSASLPEPGTGLTELEVEAVVNEAAARASEAAFRKLGALGIPPGSKGRVSQIFALMEQQTNVLYQTAAAASAGDAARVQVLSQLRISLTHRKDRLMYRLSRSWSVDPEALYGCPVSLSG